VGSQFEVADPPAKEAAFASCSEGAQNSKACEVGVWQPWSRDVAIRLGAATFGCIASRRVVPAITIGNQVDDTKVDDIKVDAEDFGRLDLVGVEDVADAGEIPVTADQRQVEFAFAVGEQIALALAITDLILRVPIDTTSLP
jgi:hypothetical protein